MRNKYRQIITLFLVLLLICSACAACTNTGSTTAVPTTIQQKTSAAITATTTAPTAANGKISDKAITLTYWSPVDAGATTLQFIKSYAENTAFIEREKITGIHIEWIHPAVGQETEQFNLMIASRNIPDLVGSADYYKGGTAVAVKDGLFLDITKMLAANAPSFSKLMSQSPDLAKQMYSDDGVFLGFCMVTSDTFGTTTEPYEESPYAGAFIRKDWLDSLGLSIPGTIDEWYTALKAMKASKDLKVVMQFPATGVNNTFGIFLSAYGIGPDFFQISGKVKYGRIDSNYKNYLTEMHKWYVDGLIDPEFATRDSQSIMALINAGSVAAVHQQSPSFINNQKKNNNIFTGTPYPTLAKGIANKWRFRNNMNRGNYTLISAANKYPVESIKWLDWGYSLQGMQLMNYGIDGKDYTGLDSNGCPKYITDYVTTSGDPTNWTSKRSVFRLHNGTYLKSDKRSNPNRWLPELENWRETWFKDSTDYNLPPYSLTVEESAENASIMTDVNTYVNEMTVKFIMGTESIEKFDAFVANIKNMNIEHAVAIQQAALDRYNKR